MTSPLALALLALLALPGGAQPRHIRQLGGTAYVAHVAAWIDSAARAEALPVALLAALIVAESQLDPNARSSVGALGLGQLNTRTPLGREWLAACRLSPEDCAELNVRVAARALRHALRVCGGDRLCAVVRYRYGHAAKPRPRDRFVVGTARTIAWRVKRESVLVAWRGGDL